MVKKTNIKKDSDEKIRSVLQLTQIIQESNDAIIGETLEGVITSWNGGAEKMFGYLAEEVIGKVITFLFPSELQKEVSILLEKVKRGEIIADYDSVRIRKDGTKIDVALSVSPIHSKNGTIIGASVVERDITKRKKAEEVLRQVQLVVENSYDAIIGTTLEGIITSWNGGAQKMFGYSGEEVIGKSGSLLFPPAIWARVPALLNKIRAKEVVADYNTGGLRKDGTEFDMAISISPIISENGIVTGASVVERDITARKKAEEVLRQIKLIVENSHDAIIGTTLDGVITSWSGGAQKMFGYLAEETIGKVFTFLLPLELQKEMSTLLGKVKRGEFIADYDSVGIRKDGLKINVALSVSPIHSEENTIIGTSIVERDITERKKVEELLRQTQLIVDNSYDAIIGEKLDGTITNWNGGATRMFGYSAEEIIGKSISILLPEEVKKEMPTLLEKIKQGKFIADYDSVMLRKDGTKIQVGFSGSPIKTKHGMVVGVSVVERDITERKKEEQQIEELNEVRNKFITIISHQLRTPLTAVNWNLETVLNGEMGKLEDTTQKYLQATYKASVEITKRINDLLSAMDIEEGRIVLEKEEMAIDSIVASIINEAKKQCKFKNITCEYVASEKDLPAIKADSEKIRTAIFKLVDNAIVYTKDNGKIIVKLEMRGDVIRFEVKDTGIGIPESEQHRVFTRFFRASNASVMQPDAFGLGLFILKNFIVQHGGKIGFESKEDKGSTFWFEIPLK